MAGADDTVISCSAVFREMLVKMTHYFDSMVDSSDSRFYYRCLPGDSSGGGSKLHSHCPIRDMGSAWDTATLLRFWNEQHEADDLLDSETRKRLAKAVATTIQVYNTSLQAVELPPVMNESCSGALRLSSKVLRELPHIAHSAFLILSTTAALRLSLLGCDHDNIPPIDKLVRGILAMQQQDGAFRIHFHCGQDDKDIYRGIAFYPGEAILAVMDAYECSLHHSPGILSHQTQQAILPAVERAFDFYSDHYHQGNVDARYTSFFANWQVQAFSKLLNVWKTIKVTNTTSKKETSLVADYILELCREIIESEPWNNLAVGGSKSYRHLSTVEIACGLEALAEGTRVAMTTDRMAEASLFWNHALQAVHFLKAVQDQLPLSTAEVNATVGYGGLGYGFGILEQRLDVTGHAANALVKLCQVQNQYAASLPFGPIS
jgi:hypothetical protein